MVRHLSCVFALFATTIAMTVISSEAQATVNAPAEVIGTSTVPTLDTSFGLVEEALNFGGADLLRDGIAFTGVDIGTVIAPSVIVPFTVSMNALGNTIRFSDATVGPDALFETEIFAQTGSAPFGQQTLINGLDPGTKYQFQFIHGDTRVGAFNDFDNNVTFTDSLGNSATTHLVFGNAGSAGMSYAVVKLLVSGSTSLAYDMSVADFLGRGPSVSGLVISSIDIPRIDNSTKGSLLIYSKVDLRWGSDGRLLQDTVLEISNDYPEDVYVQMYFINGDEPRDPIFALDPPVMVSEGEPGWNWVDCQTLLTSNQPKYWSASSGSPLGCQPFTILDPDGGNGPGRLDPESQDGGRVLRGYVVAWAVDAQGHPIPWNHLSGAATIVNYDTQTAWEYNAWAAQRCDVPTLHPPDGTTGVLPFDGIAYNAGFDVLLMDFYASGSTALSGGGYMASSDTDLTLHPLSADLRQDSAGPLTTKAHFDIWNGNEQRFSGTHRCITCWDQTLLSRYDAPNHFLLGFLGTDKGKARIDGQRSDVCDIDCIPAAIDQSGTDWGVCSYDASLIGVVARILEFSGPVTGRRAISGRSLVGAGRQHAQILYDIVAPPGELRDDAYEALGGIQSDAPVRIGSPEKAAGRATVRH